MMKERVERKLGCSIEEYMKLLEEHDKKYKDCETDFDRSFPDSLTYEELDFVGEYMDMLAMA